jgi:hypothetical protein
MLDLGECRNSSALKRIAQTCATSDEFADLVNEGCEMLMPRGDFPQLTVPIYVCVKNGCIVWNRYVGAVRKINVCNHSIPVHNTWYQFLPSNQSQCWRQWRGHNCGLTQMGQSAVLQDVQGDGRLIRAYPRCLNDIGKNLTIFGTDNNGQPLQERDSSNNWVPGVTIQLANPFGSTSVFVRHIDYIVRDETQCITDVFAYNATTNLLEEIAHYDPTETTPSYSRTQLSICHTGLSTSSTAPCCSGVAGVLAMVKLRFIKAKYDTDLVLIDNLEALKKIIQSIRFGEAGDRSNCNAYKADAIEELNRQSEDIDPEDQFSAANNVLGAHGWANQIY